MSPTETVKTIGKEPYTFPDGLQYKDVELPDGTKERLFFSDSQSRLEEESYEMYKIRRTMINKVTKKKLRGIQVWPPMGFKNIPYTPELDEKIGELYQSIINQRKDNDGN